MNYLVIEIQTNQDGTIGNLVYSYADRSQAESKYHTILSSAAVSQLPVHAAALMTAEGQLLERKCYHHTVEAEETE